MNFDRKVRSRIRTALASDLPRMGGTLQRKHATPPLLSMVSRGGTDGSAMRTP